MQEFLAGRIACTKVQSQRDQSGQTRDRVVGDNVREASRVLKATVTSLNVIVGVLGIHGGV